MTKKISLFIVVAYLLSGCAQKVSNYNFDNVHNVKIDESKTVLTKLPFSLIEIDDSTISAINNSGQQLSLYNIYSGKNTGNFSTEKIPFDSLIKATFQKKYAGKREYRYDSVIAGGLGDGKGQIYACYYSDNLLYMYIRTVASVKYINDSVGLSVYTTNEKVKETIKNYENVDFDIMEQLEFIFVVNSQLKLIKVIPVYKRTRLSEDKYSFIFQKGFAVINGNQLFAPIFKDNQAFEKMTSKLTTDKTYFTLISFSLSAIDIQTTYKLSYKNIDFNDFSLNDYFNSHFVFQKISTGLIFSNGKEICNVETGAKLFSKDRLKINEWLGDFNYDNDNNLAALTYTMIPKIHPTAMDLNYGIDSVGEVTIKVFYADKSKTHFEKSIDNKTSLSALITKSKIIYFDKDEKNYYLKYISYTNED